MKQFKKYIVFILACIALLVMPPYISTIKAKDFTVVIDPGHGGHDPGALGRFSKEKNINLKVALKLGRKIQQNCPDVKVVYTRSKDVFIPLNRRAEIANNAKADLFISIHTNALAKNKTYKGASTWTLGLAKSDANLEVAKRENAVILYENDYETRYAGFNPNSSESYIIFELMQDKYMSQSVHLASLVQKQFKQSCQRIDRGVHQAGFLVLKASAMPSVLIELGFISTPEEEKYLNSEEGSTTMANGIYQAFLSYKKEQEIRMKSSKMIQPAEEITQSSSTAVSTLTTAPTNSGKKKQTSAQTTTNKDTYKPTAKPIFKIQILASSHKLRKNDQQLKGLNEAEFYQENGLYKYTYEASSDYNKVMRTLRTIKPKFPDAFIIAFKNGKKINVRTAIQEFKNNRK